MIPLLSIIIPTYNSSGTLGRTLDSILSQTWQDYDILIIDNKSTDNTIGIIKAYQEKTSKICVISEPDKGIYDAMNKAIKLAKGEWLYFIGSDDRLLDVNVLKNIFNSDLGKTDVVYGNVISDRFDGRYDGEFSLEKLLTKNICHQSIFLNKRVFKKIGNFNIKYKTQADWDHNLRWFINPHIRKQYINIDVADYANGGASSQFPDLIFPAEMYSQVIKNGFFNLPADILKRLTASEDRKSVV